MLVATCAECHLEASLDAAAVVEGDLRCQACDGALVLMVADGDDPMAQEGVFVEGDGYAGVDDGYAKADDGYAGADDGYAGADDGYVGADERYRVRDDGGYVGADERYGVRDDGYVGTDGRYRGRDDDGSAGVDDGYDGVDDGYDGADDGYAGVDDGYAGADDGYRADGDTSEFRLQDQGYEVESGAFGGDLSVNFGGVFADDAEPGFPQQPPTVDYSAPTSRVSREAPPSLEELGLDDDPFARAAAQLDSSISATIQRARRTASYEDDLPPELEDLPGVADEGPGLDDTVTAARTEILEGEAPTEEPLPSFDGGDTFWIESLADEQPQASLAPPLSLDSEAPVDSEVTGVIALPLVKPEAPGEPGGDPLEGTQRTPLFGDEAVDWLALLDDNLTESAEDDPDAQRVFITLPESAAPSAALEEETFKDAVRQLEEGGAEAFAQAYSKTGRIDMSAATQAIASQGEGLMAQLDTRNWSQGTGEIPVPQGGDATVAVHDTSKFAAEPAGEGTVPLSEFDTGSIPQPSMGEGTVPMDELESTRGTSEGTLPLEFEGQGSATARSAPPPGPDQGTLEWDRSGADSSLVTLIDGDQAEADYFRQLYQRVFHSERGEGPRVVLVTSPNPGEGKTTIATNLAIVAARIPHKRAFLVDADPRGGGVLRYLGVRRRVDGLLEALEADDDPAKSLLPLDVAGDLRVLPLGIPGSQAIDLLGSDRRVGDLLSRLRSVDPQAVIVIDGSYALDVADPLVWARLVDGVIVVARSGKTSRADLRQAIELVGFEKVLGVVLNDTQVRKR